LTAKLIVNKHVGSSKSVTAAASSVKNSYSINEVSLVELDFPPLTDTLFSVSEFVASWNECKFSWITSIFGGLLDTAFVEANFGVSFDVVRSSKSTSATH
jgi:hypothetical protein